MFYTLMVFCLFGLLAALIGWVLLAMWIWQKITDDQSLVIIGATITAVSVPLLAGAIFLDLSGM